MLPGRFVVSVLLLVGACGDDGGTVGPIDAPFVPVDIDNGSCGDQIRFTGEYLDWDSDASFCGINEALLEVDGGGAMDSTAPNGRFDLCVPDQATTRLTITQPLAMSQCTVPASSYSIPVIAVANKMVIQGGAFWSGRAFTTARQATFFQGIGVAFDSNKAHVFVHVDGTTPRAVSLTATHGPVQAIVTTTWAPGDTGHDVFFPNVDVGAGSTMLSVAGGAIGTGSIPLVAGTITNVTVLVP